jgi:uncharacterized membrane protein
MLLVNIENKDEMRIKKERKNINSIINLQIIISGITILILINFMLINEIFSFSLAKSITESIITVIIIFLIGF